MANKEVIYIPGESGHRFHLSRAFLKMILGPVGSGKSSTCVMDLLMNAMNQAPNKYGVRQSRHLIIRNTFPELRSTTVKTFQAWIPDSICPVVYSIPFNGRMKQTLPDGTHVDAEFIFLALDRPDDVSKLLSLELTTAWINEVREIDREIVNNLIGRVGRYPALKDGVPPTYPCILLDTNAPKSLHWTHEVFRTGQPLPAGWEYFEQPPAVFWDQELARWVVNPDAENLQFLPDKYYEHSIEGSSDAFVRNMLACEPSVSIAGKPVFPNFSHRLHVAPAPLVPVRGLPILVGMDVGLNPAAVIGQVTNRGLRILQEIIPGDSGMEEFLDDYLLPAIAARYQGYKIVGVLDPAGMGRGGIDKRTSLDVLHSRGIRAHPASTNSIAPRLEAVNFFLNRIDGLQIDPSCQRLIDGMTGEYCFELVHGTGSKFKELPTKDHPVSDIADSLQYMAVFARFGRDSSPQARRRSGEKTETKPYAWAG
jgi:hypothetical protein